MRIYAAGSSVDIQTDIEIAKKTIRLFSYYHLNINGFGTTTWNFLMNNPKNTVNLMLDSGAFSAWSQKVTIDLDQYITFCLKYARYIDYIINLDVIPAEFGRRPTKAEAEQSAKDGWRNYKYMLSKGIPYEKLIPVFHQGEDMKWLTRMKKIPYIGLSPANDRTTSQKIQWLDECMNYVTDADGYPVNKWHGFAVTSLRLMLRYPWYSVDSTSWVITGRNGAVIVPQFRNGQYDYLINPFKIAVSNRSPSRKETGWHLSTFPKHTQKVILHYLDEKGFKIGRSEFRTESEKYKLQEGEKWNGKAVNKKREVETIIELGLCNDYKLRDELNIIYYLDLEKAIPPYPRQFKIKNKSGLF